MSRNSKASKISSAEVNRLVPLRTHHYYFRVYALDAEVEGTLTRLQERYAGNNLKQNRIEGT